MRPGKGVCGGAKIFGSAYYSQRAVFASLRFFSLRLNNLVGVAADWPHSGWCSTLIIITQHKLTNGQRRQKYKMLSFWQSQLLTARRWRVVVTIDQLLFYKPTRWQDMIPRLLQPIYLSVCLSVCLSIYLSIYLFKKSRLGRRKCRDTTRAPNNVN